MRAPSSFTITSACSLSMLSRPEGSVKAGATFSFVDLTTHYGDRLLVLDVLALAVQPGKTERRGVGSLTVAALKTLARREAAALSAASKGRSSKGGGGVQVRPLLLVQADLACVGFWGKCGFQRTLDANALVRSLRRASDATIFTGAVPMAHLLAENGEGPRGQPKTAPWATSSDGR